MERTILVPSKGGSLILAMWDLQYVLLVSYDDVSFGCIILELDLSFKQKKKKKIIEPDAPFGHNKL